MKDNSGIYHRRSIRLKDYDYSRDGAYFVTVCAHNRECLFGEIINGGMKLNKFGEIVNQCWQDLPNHYKHIALDYFIIMPNHIHGIINIVGAGLKPAHVDVVMPEVGAGLKPAHVDVVMPEVGAGLKPAPTNHGLPEYVRALKTFSARKINQILGVPGVPVWQRNYYEHVIRDANDLNRIREYIQNNPVNWENDENNPAVKL